LWRGLPNVFSSARWASAAGSGLPPRGTASFLGSQGSGGSMSANASSTPPTLAFAA